MNPTSSVSDHEREMIANVRKSSLAALEALRCFHQSLVAAGLPDGIGSYRRMCDTLFSQSLWMLDKEDVVAYRNFEDLSATARAIVEILEPYTIAFKKLSALPSASVGSMEEPGLGVGDDVEEPNDGESHVGEEAPAHEKVIQFLRSARKRSSVTMIRSRTGLPRKDLESVLDGLCATGRIARKRVGGRDMFKVV